MQCRIQFPSVTLGGAVGGLVPVTGGLCINNAGSLYAVCSNILQPDIRNISSPPFLRRYVDIEAFCEIS